MNTSNYHIYLAIITGLLLQYLSKWVLAASLRPSETPSPVLRKLIDAVPHNTSYTTDSDVQEFEESKIGALRRIKRNSRMCRRQADNVLWRRLRVRTGRSADYMDTTPHNFPNRLYFASNETSSSSRNRRLRKRDVVAVLRDGHHQDLPQELQQRLRNTFVTPEQNRSPRTIRSATGTSTFDYCDGALPIYPDGFLKLCSTCTVTTDLSENYFPRFLDEVVCDVTQSSGCLNGKGRCRERVVEITLLKSTGMCEPVRTRSRTYFVEEWVEETRRLRVGCECHVDPQAVGAAALILGNPSQQQQQQQQQQHSNT